MSKQKEYIDSQISFCNDKLLEISIKLNDSKTGDEFKILSEIKQNFKDLLEYYYSF